MAASSPAASHPADPHIAVHHAGAPHLAASHIAVHHPAAPHLAASYPAVHYPAVHDAGALPHHMSGLAGATAPHDNQQAMRMKFNTVAFWLGIMKLLGLIIALSLWQTSNEAAAIVFLCITYYSSYVLNMLGSFLQNALPNLDNEMKFNELHYQFLDLKYLLGVQFCCIYLQRDIVPDLWLFGVAAPIFVARAVIFIRLCFQLYNDNAFPNKYHFFTLVICTVCCISAQIGFFIAFAITYGMTTTVQSKLPVGALFVPILFGQIADIVIIVITKNWEVPVEVSGISV
jgi:hypothetical protein